MSLTFFPSELTLTRLYQIAEALKIPMDVFFRGKELTIAEPSSLYGRLSDEEESLLRVYKKVRATKQEG